PWSETVFSTRAIGTVVLAMGGRLIGSASNAQQACNVQSFPNIQVTISPAAVTLLPSGTQQFSVEVTGDTDTAVIWSVQEGSAGAFAPPPGLSPAPPAAGPFHVVATSHADSTRSATATIVVQPPQIQVSVSPPAGTLFQGST